MTSSTDAIRTLPASVTARLARPVGADREGIGRVASIDARVDREVGSESTYELGLHDAGLDLSG